MNVVTFREEWFKSADGIVYKRWSFDGGTTWETHRTFYREVPFVKVDTSEERLQLGSGS